MRAFVGLELPEETKEKLVYLQEELKGFGCDLRWTEEQNLHLTLKFLGSTEPEQCKHLKKAIATVASRQSAFSLSLKGVGVYPDPRHPAVLWTGVQQGKEALKALASDVEEAVAFLGWEKEKRPFDGHVTLARFKSRKGWAELKEAVVQRRSTEFGSLKIGHVALFESHLERQGSRYNVLGRYPLRLVASDLDG